MATDVSATEKHCTFLFHTDKAAAVQQEDILRDLEDSDVRVRIRALKQSIMLLLAGESLPRVLMHVIRFCINTDDHQLMKLLMLFWEIVPKYGADGKLLPEMILVCNAMRNNLTHPNEYVRGSMLRLLCKLHEPQLLEPLVPSVKQCLEHRHSYVRRNAALALYYIHKHVGAQLVPDAPELMEQFIMNEGDMCARRNAFLMLFNEAEEIAIDFLVNHMDDVAKYGDGFSLLVLELTRRVCRREPAKKSLFIRCLFQMLTSSSPAVSYEAAWTLVSLSQAPTAVRAAAQTYAELLSKQSDNNVKLIILERLSSLKQHHAKIVQEVLMDILRVLSSPNMDICKKTLDLVLDLIGPRNIEDVVQILKREVVRSQEADMDHGTEYRHLLVQTIHRCVSRFPDIAQSVVHVLMDFLGGDAALDIIIFVRTIMEQYPNLRAPVLDKLLESFGDLTGVDALSIGLWILGEYGRGSNNSGSGSNALEDGATANGTNEGGDATNGDMATLLRCFKQIKASLGDAPFSEELVQEQQDAAGASETKTGEEDGSGESGGTRLVTKNVVLEDGTYATQTVEEPVGGATAAAEAQVPNLRKIVLKGNVFIGTIACVSMTKLALHAMSLSGETNPTCKALQVSTLLTMCGIAQAVQRKGPGTSGDCLARLTTCSRMLLDARVRESLMSAFLQSSRNVLRAMLAAHRARMERHEDGPARHGGPASQADDLIQFRQLRSQGVQGGLEVDLMDGDDISRAAGADESEEAKLRHVYQLSGFSDPVYAEATVTVHDYDIVLDILVVNRTPSTLTSLTVELATMGDLKVVERPQVHTIGPLDQRHIRSNIKVSSTDTGHIFGTIVYENSSNAEKGLIHLNDIQLDIMDYIRPATCSDVDFRKMWAEFEWENRVAVNTPYRNLRTFLMHIIKTTNMSSLTPLTPPRTRLLDEEVSANGDDDSADGSGDGSGTNGGASRTNGKADADAATDAASLSESARDPMFLAANLYAKSLFGEEALANVSVEKRPEDGKIAGYIRIRSKTQGIALSLGDRFTTVQRQKEKDSIEDDVAAQPAPVAPGTTVEDTKAITISDDG